MIEINDVINTRYKVIRKLGFGGMSEVFEAYDIIFKRNVAIKLILPQYIDKPENIIRFENEARFQSSLNHPNIVKVYDYNVLENCPYMVNEYIKGSTLRDYLKTNKHFVAKEATRIMIQLCDALIYVHSKNIIHRDIKPQNIFYNSVGDIKLGDFGISYLLNSNFNVYENKKVMGTVQYLAPEIIRGRTPSFQSDIYAMGITYFELLTGRLPFEGNSVSEVATLQLNDKMVSPLTIIPTLSKEIEKVVFKATDKNVEYRYKTVSQFREDLLAIYNDTKIKKGFKLFNNLFKK